MENQKEMSEILVKATAQGFSIAIYGKRQEDGTWKCSLEKNEITITGIPADEHVTSLGELRDYKKTEFDASFEQAFKEFDDSEWFLSHPSKLHPEFADFVLKAFEKRMDEYNEQFPVDSPMEKFIRESKVKEWNEKVDKARSNNP